MQPQAAPRPEGPRELAVGLASLCGAGRLAWPRADAAEVGGAAVLTAGYRSWDRFDKMSTDPKIVPTLS